MIVFISFYASNDCSTRISPMIIEGKIRGGLIRSDCRCIKEVVLEGLDVRFVFNPNYEQGQATSVQCGLETVTSSCGGVMICLGDQPSIGESETISLIDAFNQRADKEIVIPRYQGQRGNPIIISSATCLHVLNNSENMGCRRYI